MRLIGSVHPCVCVSVLPNAAKANKAMFVRVRHPLTFQFEAKITLPVQDICQCLKSGFFADNLADDFLISSMKHGCNE